LDALGDRKAARDLLQDTVDRYRRTLGQDHPDTLRAASNLAEILHKQGSLQAALDLYQDTLDRYQRTLGEDHPDTRDVAGSLGEVWLELGETR
jgi:tetratricopeptide (TPR) repeat protein